MANPLTIRVALPEEHAAIEALFVRASLANEGDRAFLLTSPDVMSVPLERITQGHLFVAERGRTIVGFASIEPRANREAELEDVFVAPEEWKQGIGRSLVEHCATYARSRGFSFLNVLGNEHAEGFYRALGFKALGSIPTQAGTPAIRMQKSL